MRYPQRIERWIAQRRWNAVSEDTNWRRVAPAYKKYVDALFLTLETGAPLPRKYRGDIYRSDNHLSPDGIEKWTDDKGDGEYYFKPWPRHTPPPTSAPNACILCGRHGTGINRRAVLCDDHKNALPPAGALDHNTILYK